MDFFEKVLIQGGMAVAWAWSALGTVFSWIGHALEAILQPVLSPLLGVLNPMCTALADGVYAVLSPLPAWLGLIIISAFAGVVMLVAFRYLSNQAGIARAKDDIKANLLALKLFKDDLGVAIRAQGRIMWALLRLQRYMIAPVLWMALPTMLLLAQMAMRYQWRPLTPGDAFLFRIDSPESSLLASQLQIETGESLTVEVGPIADSDDVSWRLRAKETGSHRVSVNNQSSKFGKEIVIGEPVQRVSPVRPGKNWVSRLLYPVEKAFDSEPTKGIQEIEVEYPELRSYIYGSDYWVLTFFIVSMLTAIVLKPLFKVRF